MRGETGVGKTRLVREAMKGAPFRGYRVVETTAAPLERNIALSPLLDALSAKWVLPFLRRLDEPWRTSMLALLPELQERSVEPFFPLVGGLSRQTCEALLRLFGMIAKSQRTILYIDEFHWTDEASLAVLHFLRRRWREGDFTLLVSYCEAELGHDDSVARFIRETELDQDTTTVQLETLNEDAALELARSVAAIDANEARLNALAKAAGGMPGFVIDLASRSNGVAKSTESDAGVPIPSSAHGIITRRVGRLNSVARNVAQSLAVTGRIARLQWLRAIAGSTQSECLEALEKLQKLQLVRWTPRGIEYRHALYGRAVYQQIRPSKRSVLHARTARVLHRVLKEPAPLEVARHYHLAGDPRSATLVQEATRSTDAMCVQERRRLLESAYPLSRGAERGALAVRLARVNYDLRLLRRARHYCDEALQDPVRLNPAQTVDARTIKADIRHLLGTITAESALAELQHLEEQARKCADQTVAVRVLDTRLQLLDRAGLRAHVAEELNRLNAMPLPSERVAKSHFLAMLGLGAQYDDPDAALKSSQRAVEIADAGRLRDEKALCAQRHARALTACGLVATPPAWQFMLRARALTKEAGLQGLHALVLLDLAEWHTVTGDHGTAAKTLSEATEATQEMDCPHIRTRRCLAQGHLAIARGVARQSG